MIRPPEGDFELRPVSWLARARAQSRQLAEARAQAVGPLVPRRRRATARSHTLRPIALRVAALLAILLLASGAWALVARVLRQPVASSGPQRSDPSSITPKRVGLTAAAEPPAPRVPEKAISTVAQKRRLIRPQAPPAAPDRVIPFEEPDGEMIFVMPQTKQPPLFSPEEWKQRGLHP